MRQRVRRQLLGEADHTFPEQSILRPQGKERRVLGSPKSGCGSGGRGICSCQQSLQGPTGRPAGRQVAIPGSWVLQVRWATPVLAPGEAGEWGHSTPLPPSLALPDCNTLNSAFPRVNPWLWLQAVENPPSPATPRHQGKPRPDSVGHRAVPFLA